MYKRDYAFRMNQHSMDILLVHTVNLIFSSLKRSKVSWTTAGLDWIGLSMVLRLRQHNIGYTADGFYRWTMAEILVQNHELSAVETLTNPVQHTRRMHWYSTFSSWLLDYHITAWIQNDWHYDLKHMLWNQCIGIYVNEQTPLYVMQQLCLQYKSNDKTVTTCWIFFYWYRASWSR